MYAREGRNSFEQHKSLSGDGENVSWTLCVKTDVNHSLGVGRPEGLIQHEKTVLQTYSGHVPLKFQSNEGHLLPVSS